MISKFIILALIAITQTYAQTADKITCGKVGINPMTPAQLWNPMTWLLPNGIAASNCYTGYLEGTNNALNGLYDELYNARPPKPRGP